MTHLNASARIRALRDKLETGILQSISGVVRNGSREARLANTSNLSFDGLEAEGIFAADR